MRGMRGDKDVNKQMKSEKQQGKEVTEPLLPTLRGRQGRRRTGGRKSAWETSQKKQFFRGNLVPHREGNRKLSRRHSKVQSGVLGLASLFMPQFPAPLAEPRRRKDGEFIETRHFSFASKWCV